MDTNVASLMLTLASFAMCFDQHSFRAFVAAVAQRTAQSLVNFRYHPLLRAQVSLAVLSDELHIAELSLTDSRAGATLFSRIFAIMPYRRQALSGPTLQLMPHSQRKVLAS
jgi:hypothetical protein